MAWKELEIETDINNLYKNLSEETQKLCDNFLIGYLKDKEVEPKVYKDTYTDEQLMTALDEIVDLIIN